MISLNDLFVCWFGAGALRDPKGTWGSLAALPFGYIIHLYSGYIGLSLSIIALFFIGVWVCNHYVRRTNSKDPSFAVIDEVVGQWIAFLGIMDFNILSISMAFILFRFFDITKIQPAKICETLPEGWGIMLDDVIAGLYAAICVFLIGLVI